MFIGELLGGFYVVAKALLCSYLDFLIFLSVSIARIFWTGSNARGVAEVFEVLFGNC